MDRTDAIRLVAKLNALADPARGGTDAERAVARDKADRLAKRFGLNRHERQQRTPKKKPRTFTFGPGYDFEFNVKTGQHSPNVRVDRHNSPRDWKIEIFPNG